DEGLEPGAEHRYRVTVTDSAGNQAVSEWVNTTVATSSTLSDYAAGVLADEPTSFWRLGEDEGTTVFDWAAFDDAEARAGVSRGVTGAILEDENTASAFSGSSDGYAASEALQTGPNTFSIEAWFQTTTTSGGKIVGFGNSRDGNSNSYDRHVYMDDSGRIWFGVYPGGVRTINSSQSYNDGDWHHVVATLSGDGMRLFVDGESVAERADVTSAQGYNGHWRIGGDNLNGWTSRPSSDYFAGAIDDLAIYPAALSDSAVANHFAHAHGEGEIPNVGPEAVFESAV
ncbi:LamG domain-containing protein, partial [Georgenia sp. 10Sc9-8]|nr:LamG domain-containing protein [Georgenia halotolerans]